MRKYAIIFKYLHEVHSTVIGRLWLNSSYHGRHGIYTVPPVIHAFTEETDANSHLFGIYTKQVALNDPIAHAKIQNRSSASRSILHRPP